MNAQPELGQPTFLDELGLQNDKFEKRILRDRAFSQLAIWTDMIRSVWKDAIRERAEAEAAIKKRDDEIYQLCMLLDLDLKQLPYTQRAKFQERVGLIKGLLCCITLTCCLTAGISLGDDDQLRAMRGRGRRGREEQLAA